jgi:hypothetical protein
MISQQQQFLALYQRLKGRSTSLSTSDLSGWVLRFFLVIDNAPPGGETLAFSQALKDHPDPHSFLASMERAINQPFPQTFPSLQDLSPSLQPISWFWTGWIPFGFITLLGAVSGAGKSFIALDLARRLIHGLPFPDGSFPPSNPDSESPSVVVYVDAEALPQVLLARALSWGMDISRLFLLLPPIATPESPHLSTGDYCTDGIIDLSDPLQRDRLINLVSAKNPQLLIIDSLTSVLPHGHSNFTEARSLMLFLKQLAQDFNLALLLIHHLRKAPMLTGRKYEIQMDDFLGFINVSSISRSVLGLTIMPSADPDDRSASRRFEVVKSNMSAEPPSLGFAFTPQPPPDFLPSASATDHPDSPPVYLKWGLAPNLPIPPSLLESCQNWLLNLLRSSSQPLKPSEIVALGEQVGFSRRTIFRARRLLASTILDTHGHHSPENHWCLSSPE